MLYQTRSPICKTISNAQQRPPRDDVELGGRGGDVSLKFHVELGALVIVPDERAVLVFVVPHGAIALAVAEGIPRMGFE